MAKAKVTLNDNGPLTWHGNGYSFERGQSAVITKDSDIAFFLAEPGFTVDITEGARPKAVVEDDEEAPASKPKKAAKPAKAAKSVPPPAEDDDADDSDDEEDGEGDEDAEDDDEAEEPADGKYTEADLKKLNKTSLLEIIEEKKLKADASLKNKDLIAIILAADES